MPCSVTAIKKGMCTVTNIVRVIKTYFCYLQKTNFQDIKYVHGKSRNVSYSQYNLFAYIPFDQVNVDYIKVFLVFWFKVIQ